MPSARGLSNLHASLVPQWQVNSSGGPALHSRAGSLPGAKLCPRKQQAGARHTLDPHSKEVTKNQGGIPGEGAQGSADRDG